MKDAASEARNRPCRLTFVRMGAGPLVLRNAEGLFGGAEVRAVTFASLLSKDPRCEVRFVVAGEALAGAVSGCRSERVPELTVYPISQGRHRPWCSPWWRQRLAPWPPLTDVPTDVYLTFGIHDPSAAVIATATMAGKKSVLFLTNEQDVQVAYATAGREKKSRRTRYRFAIEHASVVVAQTEQQAQSLTRHSGRPAVVLRNPIDLGRLPTATIRLSEREYVLWVGRADRDCKRADLCMDIARQCPSVPFQMVMNDTGDGTYDQLVDGKPNNVTIVPQMDWFTSDQVYRQARVLLNTSVTEGFPNALLQAARWGVPTVSLSVDPDHVLAREKIGVVCKGDLDIAAKVIRQFWNQPEAFETMGIAARRYVEASHDGRRIAQQLMKCIFDRASFLDRSNRVKDQGFLLTFHR